MLDDLKRLFAQTWSAFLEETARRDPADEVAGLLASMRREMVQARADLPLYEKNVAGAEAELPYDRPPLSKDLLKGKVEPDRVQLRKVEQLEAEWRLGDPAISLDLGTRTVRTAGGEEVAP